VSGLFQSAGTALYRVMAAASWLYATIRSVLAFASFSSTSGAVRPSGRLAHIALIDFFLVKARDCQRRHYSGIDAGLPLYMASPAAINKGEKDLKLSPYIVVESA
jgi:hypothetical protein